MWGELGGGCEGKGFGARGFLIVRERETKGIERDVHGHGDADGGRA
jgi:hypothetical protein